MNRNEHLAHRYGLTPEEYALLWQAQGGRCKICGRKLKLETAAGAPRTPPLDHDHATGFIRGILCLRCNNRLGWYERYRSSIDDYVQNAAEDFAVTIGRDAPVRKRVRRQPASLAYKGVTMRVTEWADLLALDRRVLASFIRKGCTLEDVISHYEVTV